MSRLEERQAAMREKGNSTELPSLRALQRWDAPVSPRTKKWKRRGNSCKLCPCEFIPHPDNPDSDVCGLCKAKAKRLTIQ